MKRLIFLWVIACLTPLAAPRAEEEQTVKLVIEKHAFTPAEAKAKAGKPLTIVVENRDASAEEFESHKLRLEKIIPGGKTATFRVRPLEPGTYDFFGEFHMDTAKGTLVIE